MKQKGIVLLLSSLIVLVSSCAIQTSTDKNAYYKLSFGVIADCQYCDVENKGVRKYSISDRKLQSCVQHMNTMNLDFTVHLGDFIDKDWKSFDVVGPIYDQLKMPSYHVLGNHDFSVVDEKKSKVVEKMKMTSEYYHFKVKGWRFVVLNGNDISFHAYAKDSDKYKIAKAYYENNAITSPKWNGAIGPVQLHWLESVLKEAVQQDEKVILYCHFPVYPQNIHNLWNAHEVVRLIEKYTVVKAYINGHNHEGNYDHKKGVHYITMKGMVDTKETSYGIIRLSKTELKLEGFGREASRIVQLKSKL